MTNAQTEFVQHIAKIEPKVIAADIRVEYLHNYYDDSVRIFLPRNFTDMQFAEFLQKLNFEYDSGYGTQHLFGSIWYADGTWSSRHEYDGSEYWQHNTVPPIPNE